MNEKQKLELAKWVISQAKKEGASDAAVSLSSNRGVQVEHREGKVEKLQESTQRKLSLSVFAKGRYSSHGTNDIRKESLGSFVKNAVAMTGYLTEDKHRLLPDPKYYEGVYDGDLGLLDSEYDSFESSDRILIVREIESVAHGGDPRVISATAGLHDTSYEKVRVHSNGFEGVQRGTMFQAGAEVTVRDGDKGRPEGWYYAGARQFKHLPDPATLANRARDRAFDKIGQGKIQSGSYEAVLENTVDARLIGSMFTAMQAQALQQKSSFLDGKLGKAIASEALTWTDDPFVKGGLGSRTFDGEGIAAKKRVIVEKGVLRSYYVDNYYGRKLEWEPTTGSYSNIVISPGTVGLEELVARMKKGILVTGFIGGNCNSTTGDFSFGIIGWQVVDGKRVRPLNEMNISGNMTDFWGKLKTVGNDPNPYSKWLTPSMHFTDVSFSGV